MARREPLWRHMLGDQLRRLRLERGETIGETAARAGVSLPYLSEIERGVKEPSSEMIAAVAGALGVRLVDLTVAVSERLQPERAGDGQNPPAPVVMLSARSQGAVLVMAA